MAGELIQGTKFDDEKPCMDLLDGEWLLDVAGVMTFGKKKYAAHNWRKGMDWSRVIGAAYRHLTAINQGQDLDPETGKPHAAHLSCCAMFLNWYLKHRTEFDNRYKETIIAYKRTSV